MGRKIRKILLIDPPVTRPSDFSQARCRVSIFTPLGLAYIAAALEKEGYTVAIIDGLAEGLDNGEQHYGPGLLRYGLSDDQLLKKIQAFGPDVVGISCLFSNKDWDMRNAAAISKKAAPGCPVVVGGVHPTALGVKLLQGAPDIDFIVLGEGESAFAALLKSLAGNGRFDAIDGLVYREGPGVAVNAKQAFIADLDTLPLPARHLLNMPVYLNSTAAHSGYKRKPFASLISSRGCPAKCTFCSIEMLWGKVPRYRSSASILSEIEHLVTKYGIKEIHFEDDNLTSNKKRALEIFNGMIERKFDVAWTVPSGLAAYSLDDELLEKMAQSGCYSISLAVESGDQKVLDTLMHKPIRLEKVKQIVDKSRSLGLKTKGFFILGFPGETKQSMQKTVDFAKGLELDWALFFMATPLIGTKIYDLCKEKHYLKDESVDFAHSFYVGNIKTEEFDCDYVERVREEANLDINFRNNPNLLKFNVDEAIADFKSVLAFYPHLWFAHHYLGEAYFKKKMYPDAVKEWKKALSLKPDCADAQNRLRYVRDTIDSGLV